MNDVEQLFQRKTRGASDVQMGTILSRNTDATYMVELVASQIPVRASNGSGREFEAGQRVLLSNPNASLSVSGTLWMILRLAPEDQRGLVGSVPDFSDRSYRAVAITLVTPQPLELIAGGDPGTIDIYGQGFLAAPTYSDPLLTDDTPAVVTPTHITLSVAADAALAPGRYDVIVSGKRIKEEINVSPVPPPELTILQASFGHVVSGAYTYAPDLGDITDGSLLVYLIAANDASIGGAFDHWDVGGAIGLAARAIGEVGDVLTPTGDTAVQYYDAASNQRIAALFRSAVPAIAGPNPPNLAARTAGGGFLSFNATLCVLEIANAAAIPFESVALASSAPVGSAPYQYTSASVTPADAAKHMILGLISRARATYANDDFRRINNGFTAQAIDATNVGTLDVTSIVGMKFVNSATAQQFSAFIDAAADNAPAESLILAIKGV